MADFDDITGFDAEIRAFYDSEEGKKKWLDEEGYSVVTRPIPISKVYQYIDLVFKHDELRAAAQKVTDWYAKYPDRHCIDDDDPENPTFPHKDQGLVKWFGQWFCMKSEIGPNSEVFSAAIHVCVSILIGRSQTAQDERITTYLKRCNRPNKTNIDWSK